MLRSCILFVSVCRSEIRFTSMHTIQSFRNPYSLHESWVIYDISWYSIFNLAPHSMHITYTIYHIHVGCARINKTVSFFWTCFLLTSSVLSFFCIWMESRKQCVKFPKMFVCKSTKLKSPHCCHTIRSTRLLFQLSEIHRSVAQYTVIGAETNQQNAHFQPEYILMVCSFCTSTISAVRTHPHARTYVVAMVCVRHRMRVCIG